MISEPFGTETLHFSSIKFVYWGIRYIPFLFYVYIPRQTYDTWSFWFRDLAFHFGKVRLWGIRYRHFSFMSKISDKLIWAFWFREFAFHFGKVRLLGYQIPNLWYRLWAFWFLDFAFHYHKFRLLAIRSSLSVLCLKPAANLWYLSLLIPRPSWPYISFW